MLKKDEEIVISSGNDTIIITKGGGSNVLSFTAAPWVTIHRRKRHNRQGKKDGHCNSSYTGDNNNSLRTPEERGQGVHESFSHDAYVRDGNRKDRDSDPDGETEIS